jgi:ectoine hydroxylase-related dioxygenase (phytanoyl-CoA dioxygenase family)
MNLAERAANQINGNHLVIPRRALGISFDDYWFNIARPGESTALHHHSQKATLPGVYYLQVPPSSGNIQFPVGDGRNYEIPVEAGLMVIFPSCVRHAVGRNESDEERVSMAFNLHRLPIEG